TARSAAGWWPAPRRSSGRSRSIRSRSPGPTEPWPSLPGLTRQSIIPKAPFFAMDTRVKPAYDDRVATISDGAPMRIDAIPIGVNPPHDVNVIIEVPVGGEPIKYEMDKEAGTLVVDRFLYTAMRYPGNYGFIPHTLSGDGDPCDVLVANTRAIVPGAVMSVR